MHTKLFIPLNKTYLPKLGSSIPLGFVSLILLLLTGCQTSPKMHQLLPSHTPTFETKLRVGLFKQQDHSPLSDKVIETKIEKKPQDLWGQLRTGFTLTYPEHHPEIQQYLKDYTASTFFINKFVKNGTPYLHFVVEEVKKRGMPLEIALLPMVESRFDPTALSKKGAVGLWQIMPTTGKVLGLERDKWYDGCKDVYASTQAALNHLQYLHRAFEGDWYLALAAYNAGERRITRAIAKNKKQRKSTTYWQLPLPRETQHYVPRLMAMVALIKNPKKYGVTLPPLQNKAQIEVVHLQHPIDIKWAAQLCKTPLTEFRKLNAGHHHYSTHPKLKHTLLIPKPQASLFQAQIAKHPPKTWLKQSQADSMYVVKKGDSLWSISKKHNIALNQLIAMNNIREGYIHPGQKLIVQV